MAAGSRQEEFIVSYGHVRLKFADKLQKRARVFFLLMEKPQIAENSGKGINPVCTKSRVWIGEPGHREFTFQDSGPPVVTDKQEFVLGIVACDGQGSNCVTVVGAVHPIENSCHFLFLYFPGCGVTANSPNWAGLFWLAGCIAIYFKYGVLATAVLECRVM